MATLMRRRIIIISICFVALFLTAWLELFIQRNHKLVGAGINRTFLFLLINAHVLVLGFLLYVIIRQSIKLFLERRKGVPGSVFKSNLLFAFTFFSVIPSFFIFFTAGKLITRSIDDWFQARIETGLKRGEVLHEEHAKQDRLLLRQTGQRLIAGQTSQQDLDTQQVVAYAWGTSSGKKFENIILRSIKEEVKIWRRFRQFNDRTMQSLFERFFRHIDGVDNEELFDFYGSLYWVKKIGSYWIILAKRYPPEIRYPLIELQNAIADYEQLKSMRNPIYGSYFLTFILVTILILFLSIWCAFYLARGITKPIQELLNATAQIRKGRWDVQLPCKASDDFRTLVEGFNEMMHAIQQARMQLEGKHNELFTILENIRASVFLVEAHGKIIMCNAAACDLVARLTGIEQIQGKRISVLGDVIIKDFFDLVRELRRTGKQTISRELIFPLQKESRVFMTTVSFVNKSDVLVVLEDITDVVKANKLRTWQEAAQQMAHEIKNPLTPIQLATQRLQRRLGKHLCDDTVFFQSTDIILEQVALIKNLVTHFSEFASMPDLRCEEADLNQIVQEVVRLYAFSYPHVSIKVILSPDLDPVFVDIKKMKRVLVNLFDNSMRALQNGLTQGGHHGSEQITITTRKSYDGRFVELLFGDTGPGIAPEVRDKLFLPYVSTEKKNMGLGLAIVHEIITQHGGAISMLPCSRGVLFCMLVPIAKNN